MKPDEFSPGFPGALFEFQTPKSERAWAFIPDPLPPDISFSEELYDHSELAMLSLGRIGGLGANLPNPNLLIRPFIRREALASSRIEGTRADLGQLVLFEASQADEDLTPDVREVSNYIRALEYGWSQISYRPISMGLIREMHAILMEGVRGFHLKPGEFRDDQNYIGTPGHTAATARFVPPPPSLVESLMQDLEQYTADSTRLSLFRLALIHYQFEAIHPFFDGNGRLGRLLVTLLLGAWNILEQPLLYISTYIEAHRDEYQQRLTAVSKQGDWHSWMIFFLTAIETQADDGAKRGQLLLKLREEYRSEYQRGKSSNAVLITIDALFERPSITISEAAALLNISYAGAAKVIKKLVDDQFLEEATGRKRNRVFIAKEILRAIEM